MDFLPAEAKVLPDRVTVKTLGILNIVFALGLLGFGLCVNTYALMFPALSMLMEQQAGRIAQNEAARKASIQKLDEQIKKAAAEDKERLVKQRDDLEDTPPDPQAETAKMFADPRLRDPRIVFQFVFDLLTGVIVNLLMLIAGVGLLYFKAWGRFLAMGVAWLKILRLMVLAGAAIAILAPCLKTMITQVEVEVLAGDAKALAEAAQDGQSVAWMVQSCALGVLLLGVIYPAATIWLLQRPSAKAAVQRIR